MTAKLSPELVRELKRAGDLPLTVEDPQNKRVYVLADSEKYQVVPRSPGSARIPLAWSEERNDRRLALVRKKFSKGIDDAEARELATLQAELADYRKRAVPLPYDVIDALREAVKGETPSNT